MGSWSRIRTETIVDLFWFRLLITYVLSEALEGGRKQQLLPRKLQLLHENTTAISLLSLPIFLSLSLSLFVFSLCLCPPSHTSISLETYYIQVIVLRGMIRSPTKTRKTVKGNLLTGRAYMEPSVNQATNVMSIVQIVGNAITRRGCAPVFQGIKERPVTYKTPARGPSRE